MYTSRMLHFSGWPDLLCTEKAKTSSGIDHFVPTHRKLLDAPGLPLGSSQGVLHSKTVYHCAEFRVLVLILLQFSACHSKSQELQRCMDKLALHHNNNDRHNASSYIDCDIPVSAPVIALQFQDISL